jgi:hypothetical protein
MKFCATGRDSKEYPSREDRPAREQEGAMSTSAGAVPSPPSNRDRRVTSAVLRACWKLVRFPALALMIILEPVVRLVLAGLALVLTLMAFFWKFAAPPQLHVPFLGMLAAAVGCIALLAAYNFVLRVLSA